METEKRIKSGRNSGYEGRKKEGKRDGKEKKVRVRGEPEGEWSPV